MHCLKQTEIKLWLSIPYDLKEKVSLWIEAHKKSMWKCDAVVFLLPTRVISLSQSAWLVHCKITWNSLEQIINQFTKWLPPWRKGRISCLWIKSVFDCLTIGIIHETMVVHMTWVWTFFNNYIYIYIYHQNCVTKTHTKFQNDGFGISQVLSHTLLYCLI